MDLATITRLDHAAVNRLTSEQYREAFDDPTNGDAFRKRIDEIDNAPKRASRANGSVRGEEAPAPSPVGSFDPSFDDAPNDAPSVSAPAPATTEPIAATEDELPILEHIYQPVDRNGKPVGGRQRFEYRTQQELIEKLTKAHSAASARIRELSRNHKLEEIVASGKSPAALSTDVPQTKDELAKELVETRHEAFLARVQMALAEFKSSKVWQPYQSTENAETLVLAVQKSGDDPRDPASFHKALENMKEFLIPVAETIAVPAPEPVEQPKAAAATAAPAPTQRVAIATGLSATDQFSSEAPSSESSTNAQVGIVVNGTRITSIAQWDKVPSDLQKRVLRLPSNARIIDGLYEKQGQERLARRSSR